MDLSKSVILSFRESEELLVNATYEPKEEPVSNFPLRCEGKPCRSLGYDGFGATRLMRVKFIDGTSDWVPMRLIEYGPELKRQQRE